MYKLTDGMFSEMNMVAIPGAMTNRYLKMYKDNVKLD